MEDLDWIYLVPDREKRMGCCECGDDSPGSVKCTISRFTSLVPFGLVL